VTARLQAVTEGVAVAVEDAGHGIEPEHLPHLLERFYRTEQRVRMLRRSWCV
jgi:signal transduction histidine kinase